MLNPIWIWVKLWATCSFKFQRSTIKFQLLVYMSYATLNYSKLLIDLHCNTIDLESYVGKQPLYVILMPLIEKKKKNFISCSKRTWMCAFLLVPSKAGKAKWIFFSFSFSFVCVKLKLFFYMTQDRVVLLSRPSRSFIQLTVVCLVVYNNNI